MRGPSRSEEIRRLFMRRLNLIAAAVLFGFVVVVAGYWYVQVVRGTHYRTLAENNRLRRQRVEAPRGLIVDREGRRLVENVPSYSLRLDRSLTRSMDESLAFAALVLDRSVEELRETMDSNRKRTQHSGVLVANDLNFGEVARFEATSLEHPEFSIAVEQRRLYRYGPETAHVLGYLTEAGDAALERDASLQPGDRIGVRGAEAIHDLSLRGQAGERFAVVDSHGRLIEELPGQRPVPGADLQLTLDLELQQEAARYFEDRVGAAVALDPRNGEILALVSSPSYDPNLFARRMARRSWSALLEAPHNPLMNRPAQAQYPPGSVFKIVMAMAGLEEGLVDSMDSVYCSGSARIYNQTRRCWRAGGHGRVDLREAIRSSCDVYFYRLGQSLGIERIAAHARRWGLGQPTGAAVVAEKGGLVPDREWSLRVRESMWYPGETISVAIGQGSLLVTPLQIATMMAAVANGGTLVVPHLVRGPTPAPRRIALSADHLERVREALWAVVNDGGSGNAAKIPGLGVSGKTGTAQVVRQRQRTDSAELPFEHRDHAWFASYAPREDPGLVVVVFVEHGGHGGAVAAPLAKRLYETYYRSLLDYRDS